MLSVEGVRELLGLANLDEVDALVRQGCLLALPTMSGKPAFPALQFTRDRRVLAGIAEVLAVLAPAVFTPFTIASWLMAPQPLLAETTPVDWLTAGKSLDLVLEAARR